MLKHAQCIVEVDEIVKNTLVIFLPFHIHLPVINTKRGLLVTSVS